MGMDGSPPYGTRWVSIDEWIGIRAVQRDRQRAPLGMMTPATQDEILAMRRRKSGPGVSHHTTLPPHLRNRRSA